MAFVFDVNNSTQTGGDSMFKLKQLLVSAGWVVKSSGDGISFSATGDVISGAMTTTTAWFRIQQPLVNSVNREFVVQRNNNNNQQWIILYSYSAGFTGGAPSATVAPTATDQQTLQNGGSAFFATDNSYRWNMAAQNAAPYGFWSGCFPSGGGTPTGGAFCLFPMDIISLTGDVDPFVLYTSSAAGAFSFSDFQNNIKTFLRKGLIYEIFTNTHACSLSAISTTVFPSNSSSTGVGPNPHDGNDDILPIMFGQNAQGTTWPNSLKGLTSMVQWNGSNRTTGDTLSVASPGAKDRICYNETNLPWNGSTPTV